MRTNSPRLQSEQLEARNLLAGDLTVSVTNGTLRIIGDRQDNQVSVSTNDTGDLIVSGLLDTTVNGSTDPFVAFAGTNTVTRNLVIRTSGGNDEVSVDGALVAGNMVVHTGSGNDELDITSATVLGESRITMGGQDDILAIAELDASRRLLVSGRAGDDTFVFGDVQVNGATRIRAGSGADRVLIAGAMQTEGRFGLKTQKGADTVIFGPAGAGDDATFGDVRIKLGKAADQLSIDSQATFANLIVRGGKGADTQDNQGTSTESQSFSITTGTVDAQTVIDAIFADLTTAGISTDVFIGVNDPDAPTVTTTTGNVTFNEGDDPIVVDSGITVADPDSTELSGATVTVSGGFETGADTLSATSQSGITTSFNAATGTLTLSGTAAIADYQTVLQSVTFENTSDNPSTATRTITFEVTDPDGETASGTRSLDITVSNDAPTIVASSTTVNYTAGSGAVALDDAVDVSDPDADDLVGATVTISNFESTEDQLAITTTGTSITSNFDAATGVLTLTGTASGDDYQQVLRTLTYENTDTDPTLTARTIVVQVDDGSETADETYTVNLANPVAPTLTGTSASGLFVEDGSSVLVDTNIAITDDGDNLTGATVTITSGLDAADVLTVTDQAGVTGNYDSATGVLTLSGTASVSGYQSVLRSVAFATTGDDPSVAIRTIEFSVTDSDSLSATFSRDFNITAINDAPTIEASIVSLEYTEGDPATVIDASLLVDDPDNADLESAIVTLGGFQSSEDVVTFDTGTTGISGNYDAATGVLSLTGTASVADYETVLRTVAYENTSTDPVESTRNLEIVISDGELTDTVAYAIGVTAVEDPLLLTLPAEFSDPNAPASATTGDTISFTPTLDGGDGSTVNYQVDIDDNPLPDGVPLPTVDSTTGAFSWNPGVAGTFTLRIIVVNESGQADQEAFTIVVQDAPS